jgi:hypothetical protein
MAALTRSQLRTRVLRELQDPTAKFYTTSIVNDLLNEAQEMFVTDTRCLRESGTINVISGTAEYALTGLTPKVLEVLRVALPPSPGQTNEVELIYLSQEDCARQDAYWRQTIGPNPWAYMRWNEGFDAIRLYPIPQTNFTALIAAGDVAFDALYGGVDDVENLTDAEFTSLYGDVDDVDPRYGALRVDYVAAPAEMDSDDDTPSIPAQWQDALYYYAVARCCEMSTPIAQVQKAGLYMGKYQEHVAQCKGLTNSQFQEKPPRRQLLRKY